MKPGQSFEFILEGEKIERVKKVVSHNGGEVVREVPEGEDVRVTVRKR